MLALCNSTQPIGDSTQPTGNSVPGVLLCPGPSTVSQFSYSSPGRLRNRPKPTSHLIPGKPCPKKAVQKQLGLSVLADPISKEGGTHDPNRDDKVKGEFLLNNEKEEVGTPDQIACFFNGKNYQALLCKCLSALDLKGPPPGEEPQGSDTHPENKTWGSREFFSHQSSTAKVFPFPIFFERQPKAEGEKPASNRQSPITLKRLYNLPDFASDILRVPLVDALVLALQSSGLLSEDGQGSVRDSWEVVQALSR